MALPDWLLTAIQQYNQAPQQDQGAATYNNPNLTMRQRVGLDDPNTDKPMGGPPLTGPLPAQGQTPQAPGATLASQQPMSPFQTAQGAPQMSTAPNSGVIGAQPNLGMQPSGPMQSQGGNGGGSFGALGMAGQSPFPEAQGEVPPRTLGQQIFPQQLQMGKMANAPRIQQFQQFLAQLRKQVPTLGMS